MGCAFFYVSSTNHGFNMKIMGLVPILKKQGKIYHTKCYLLPYGIYIKRFEID